MTTLLSTRSSIQPILAAALATAPVIAMTGEALAHETGAPHGAAEHLALYGGAATLLAIAGYAIARVFGGRAEQRVRIERDDPRRRRPRR